MNNTVAQPRLGFTERLTQKANLKHTRYGWLRLTPAYSVHLVADILAEHRISDGIVLDPFCGTGTTALVCVERGICADTIDINPFLVWLARTKCANYSMSDLDQFSSASSAVLADALSNDSDAWVPAIHEIEKWWDAETVQLLGRAMAGIRDNPHQTAVADLLKIVFCRVMIEAANVSFGHQSMSFKAPPEPCLFHDKKADFAANWRRAAKDISDAARLPIEGEAGVSLVDARRLDEQLTHNHYDCVITSPPYPNRMSYIRELRPYMYWLGFLTSGRQAGELDWEAIGGTWGCATSNLQKWNSNGGYIPFHEFTAIISGIRSRSNVLGTYVEKYFHDMLKHVQGIHHVVKNGGHVNYIVGNSKFYDVLLPVEQIFAALFREVGFKDVAVRILRKRTSKKELFEYLVSGIKSV